MGRMTEACFTVGRFGMSGKDFEIEEGKEVVGRTIVGGRPRVRRKMKLKIPIGIEKLLCRAAAAPELKRELLEERDSALARIGDELNDVELEVLRSIPPESLAAMIERIDLKRHPRRRFMKGVMVAAFAATAATTSVVSVGCEFTGNGADDVPPVDEVQTEETIDYEVVTRGAEPDEDFLGEPDVIDKEETIADTGIPPGF